jgi:hypothetical protein
MNSKERKKEKGKRKEERGSSVRVIGSFSTIIG